MEFSLQPNHIQLGGDTPPQLRFGLTDYNRDWAAVVHRIRVHFYDETLFRGPGGQGEKEGFNLFNHSEDFQGRYILSPDEQKPDVTGINGVLLQLDFPLYGGGLDCNTRSAEVAAVPIIPDDYPQVKPDSKYIIEVWMPSDNKKPALVGIISLPEKKINNNYSRKLHFRASVLESKNLTGWPIGKVIGTHWLNHHQNPKPYILDIRSAGTERNATPGGTGGAVLPTTHKNYVHFREPDWTGFYEGFLQQPAPYDEPVLMVQINQAGNKRVIWMKRPPANFRRNRNPVSIPYFSDPQQVLIVGTYIEQSSREGDRRPGRWEYEWKIDPNGEWKFNENGTLIRDGIDSDGNVIPDQKVPADPTVFYFGIDENTCEINPDSAHNSLRILFRKTGGETFLLYLDKKSNNPRWSNRAISRIEDPEELISALYDQTNPIPRTVYMRFWDETNQESNIGKAIVKWREAGGGDSTTSRLNEKRDQWEIVSNSLQDLVLNVNRELPSSYKVTVLHRLHLALMGNEIQDMGSPPKRLPCYYWLEEMVNEQMLYIQRNSDLNTSMETLYQSVRPGFRNAGISAANFSSSRGTFVYELTFHNIGLQYGIGPLAPAGYLMFVDIDKFICTSCPKLNCIDQCDPNFGGKIKQWSKPVRMFGIFFELGLTLKGEGAGSAPNNPIRFKTFFNLDEENFNTAKISVFAASLGYAGNGYLSGTGPTRTYAELYLRNKNNMYVQLDGYLSLPYDTNILTTIAVNQLKPGLGLADISAGGGYLKAFSSVTPRRPLDPPPDPKKPSSRHVEYSLKTYFEKDQSEIPDLMISELDQELAVEAAAIWDVKDGWIKIFGYTCTLGNDDYNINLSKCRAINTYKVIRGAFGQHFKIVVKENEDIVGKGEELAIQNGVPQPNTIPGRPTESECTNYRRTDVEINGLLRAIIRSKGQ